MTALEKIKKYKSFPSTLIINGLSSLGIQVAKTLLEQKGLVIILDKYQREKKLVIEELSSFESFVFIDIDGNEELLNKIEHLDYLIYLENDSLDKEEDLSPNEFLKKINYLNKFLEFAIKKSAKVLLTTSLKAHQISLGDYLSKDYDPKSQTYTSIEQQRYIEKLSFDLYKKYNLDIRIIRLGEIYGPKIELSEDSVLQSLIKQSTRRSYIRIKGDGLEENFFVHINDAIYGIIKAIFSSSTNGEVFNLANYEDISTLSIAYALLDTNCKAEEIRFISGKNGIKPATYDPTPNLSKIGWKPRIDLRKGLTEIVEIEMQEKAKEEEPNTINADKFQGLSKIFNKTSESYEEQKSSKKSILDKLSDQTVSKKRIDESLYRERKVNSSTKNNLSKRKIKLHWRRYLFYTTLFLIIYGFLIAPILGFMGNIVFAGINGYKSISLLREDNYIELGNSLNKLENNIKRSQDSLKGLNWIARIIRKEEERKNIDNFLAGTRHLALGGKQSIELIQPLISYTKTLSLNPDNKVDYSDYMEKIKNNSHEFDLAYIELIKANEMLSSVDYSFIMLSEKQSEEIKVFQEDLFRRVVDYKDFISVIPQLLGHPSEKSYLFIFQNDFELRSTGGFIGSYAIVNMNNGKIENIKIDDIYNPDGQLKEYIEPPDPFKIAFPGGSWGMRDANWEPDFPTSAKQIEWFYKKATGQEVDGVIAINTNIIQELLEILEPVTIDDGTIITKANFFEEAEAHHLTFEPGSTDKKDFLGNLSNALIEKLGDRDNDTLMKVGSLIEKMLSKREMFIYLNDAQGQKIIVKRGWDGSILNQKNDYLFIVENNLGANKVNKDIERKINQTINIEEYEIIQNLRVEYTNNSMIDVWPGGKYLNFVQNIIPKNAEIIKVEGLRDSKIEEKYGYKVVSGWVEVEHQSTYEYSVSYKTFSIYDKPVDKKIYNHLVQKQSGIGNAYIDINITYPEDWKINRSTSSLTQSVNDIEVSYLGLLNKDVEIELIFNK